MANETDIRLYALETLVEVEKKKIFVKDALHKQLFQQQFLSKQDRAFLTRIVEGVTEYQVRLDYIINCFSKTKVNKCKPVIRVILRMGVYQMLYMDKVPLEAACNESVRLAKKKGFKNLSGFVNGVLRSVSRNIDHLEFPSKEDSDSLYLSLEYSMPEWLVEKLINWYGVEKATQILEASVKIPDLTIRVNENKISKDALISKLEDKGIEVTQGHYVEDALHLKNINYVEKIPGFSQGEFFIQDESSMLLYQIADIDASEKNKLHILDLCAAPGGKCTQFAQKLQNRSVVDARDVSERKLSLIRDNIERLALQNIETKVWDALVPDLEKKEWADIVIADLPCSGLGILSKKNDIKYHLTEMQLLELTNLQKTILANAAEYVKPGGILLYSTCTINPSENEENAKWFLDNFSFEPVDITRSLPDSLKKQVSLPYMIQLLPGIVDCDGFFIAKFKKNNV